MPRQGSLWIVIAVVAVIVIAIVAYHLARFLKGSIKLQLGKRGFGAGDEVTGSFWLVTKRPVDGNRLYAALIGEEVTRYEERDHDGGHRTRTRTREVYRDEQVIEEARRYPGGFRQQYSFMVRAPAGRQSQDLENLPGGRLLEAGLKGLQMLSGHHSQMRWKVEARLDAKGVDLADSAKVTINV
jgi:hypothetical protein